MRIVIDRSFVPARVRQGRIYSIVGFLLLFGGWLLTLVMSSVDTSGQILLISLFTILVGFPLFNSGRYMAQRWGIRPREDEVLDTELKSLDQRFTLYHYIKNVPVEHFLLTPAGIFVIHVRHQPGRFAVRGDQARKRDVWSRKVRSPLARFLIWSRSLTEGALGNPSQDLEENINQMRKYLAQNLPEDILQTSAVESAVPEAAANPAPLKSTRGGFELTGLFRRPAPPSTKTSPIPVSGVIVFTNRLASVEINDPLAPVVPPAELRDYFRNPAIGSDSQVRLSVTTLRRLSRIWETEDASTPPTRPSARRTTVRPRRPMSRR